MSQVPPTSTSSNNAWTTRGVDCKTSGRRLPEALSSLQGGPTVQGSIDRPTQQPALQIQLYRYFANVSPLPIRFEIVLTPGAEELSLTSVPTGGTACSRCVHVEKPREDRGAADAENVVGFRRGCAKGETKARRLIRRYCGWGSVTVFASLVVPPAAVRVQQATN